MYPNTRMRRYRKNLPIRKLVREIEISKTDYIYPIFVVEGKNVKKPINSMPGIFQFSLDRLLEEIQKTINAGIETVMLFGIPEKKDSLGKEAYSKDGIIQKAIKLIKSHYPDLLVATDVCLCEYTDHGHCGVINKGIVLNDPTLDLLEQVALSHAEAGADILSPSDMMDGRIGKIRKILDKNGYSDVLIMAHSAKFASSFYGPFREAAESAPQFGDRKTYQMDPQSGNKQAMREIELDINEGADFIIIKPGLSYMDLVKEADQKFNVPIVCYNVSGEYSMVKAASLNGWIDEKSVVLEMMIGFKRAGAKAVITYHALDIAKWIDESQKGV